MSGSWNEIKSWAKIRASITDVWQWPLLHGHALLSPLEQFTAEVKYLRIL